ncbi:MAG: hypothetical protein ACXAE3_04470 [Candidatus Kariarchaeaceae archaeon]|jgi:hypothetical protein
MSERYFAFESITGRDENNLAKIELGTDTRSEMRFETILYDFEEAHAALLMIDYLTMLKPASYEISQIEYRDWYANELIRRVTEDQTFFETQPDAKKEVLKELLNRRNKLTKQLDRMMNYYHDNKHRIDEIEKIRALYQKPFPGPQLAILEDRLVFENISEYGDIFYQIGMRMQIEEESENVIGTGWIEYSKYFSENLKSLSYTPGGLHISNTKSRTDIRVLRRGDSRPFRLLGDSEVYRRKSEEIGMISEFIERGDVLSVALSPVILFQLISGVRRYCKDNKPLQLLIEPGQGDGHVSVTSTQIKIRSRHIATPYITTTNSSVFLTLDPAIHLLEGGSLELYPRSYGFALSFSFGDVVGKIYSNIRGSARDNQIHKVLSRYLATHSNNRERFVGSVTQLGQTSYKRLLEDLEFEVSHRERRAALLISTNPENFEIESDRISHIGRGNAVISWEEDFVLECDCGKIHPVYLCEHILACLIIGFQEGFFNV